MVHHDDDLERWAGIAIISLLMTMFLIGLMGCTYEKEVQAKISVGQVVRVQEYPNRYVLKIRDIYDSIIYADYFSKNPLPAGQMVLIIVRK